MENNFFIVFDYAFTYILMPHNMKILQFIYFIFMSQIVLHLPQYFVHQSLCFPALMFHSPVLPSTYIPSPLYRTRYTHVSGHHIPSPFAHQSRYSPRYSLGPVPTSPLVPYFPTVQKVDSSPPSAPYMRQWIGSALVQIMACRLFDAVL